MEGYFLKQVSVPGNKMKAIEGEDMNIEILETIWLCYFLFYL
jgi:hypothetical protein